MEGIKAMPEDEDAQQTTEDQNQGEQTTDDQSASHVSQADQQTSDRAAEASRRAAERDAGPLFKIRIT